MKCSMCNEKIEETFLGKILGTYIKDGKGKKQAVCSACQKKVKNDRKAMLEQA